jgi:hypothetical protein
MQVAAKATLAREDKLGMNFFLKGKVKKENSVRKKEMLFVFSFYISYFFSPAGRVRTNVSISGFFIELSTFNK